MAASSVLAVQNALQDLVTTYHELNGAHVDELDEEPSALEFMRYVARNRPFVVRKGASGWAAVQRWDCRYLVDKMKDRNVNVAITPHGNADAVVTAPDGVRYFVKPYEVEEPFADFLAEVRRQERDGDVTSNVMYAQTQNDNLRGEYSELFEDVEQDISCARIALEQQPDAINLWIGNSRSVTALHRDNYENIYCQVIGQKHFTLVSPVETGHIDEQCLPSATYMSSGSKGNSETPDSLPEVRQEQLVITPDKDSVPVPCATLDVNRIEQDMQEIHHCRPIRVTLGPGDMLYLPALWYHTVSQTCGDEGICCAVNYWYDMDFGGFLYSSSAFIRAVALAVAQKDEQRP
ncbi:hypothetical protein MMC26_000912 [Xylographa opegraphella]|nr:hypothetical protein [Xylographa opegraphella]